MRPLKLTMQAFGPYAGQETIDFTKLENRTMFVISGKTGSGKTTIFDGISYAIYGKASGDDREGTDLRSQFANEDLLTEVELEFTLRGKTYLIKRSPQQERRKKSGDGVTKTTAKAELYLLDNGEKRLLAANVRDVGEKIKEIMLIDSNQFRQILMIPQGDFRKLLTSDSTDKEKILQRLFHTEIYKRIEKKLDEEAGELKKTVKQQIENRNNEIRRISALYNSELQAFLEAGSENDTIVLSLLQDEMSLMSSKLSELQKEMIHKQTERDGLQQKLNEAKVILEQMRKLKELEVQKENLLAQKERFQLKEKEIILANKANLLAKQEELCHRLKRELDQAKKDVEQRQNLIASLSNLLIEREEAFNKEKAREDERIAIQEKINHLQHIKADVLSFSKTQSEVQSIERALEETKRKKQSSEEALKRAEAEIKQLSNKKEEIDKSQLIMLENERKIEKFSAELDLLEKYETQATELQKGIVKLQTTEENFHTITKQLLHAKDFLEQLEQKWIHGQAAILANDLQEGGACPVCGSEHHPSPASIMVNEIPNEQDIKNAKYEVTKLEQEKAKIESSLFEIKSRVGLLKQTITELSSSIQIDERPFDVENLINSKNEILSKRQALINSQLILKENEKLLDKLIVNLEEQEEKKELLAHQLTLISEQANELSITFTEKNTILSRMKEGIPDHLRSVPAFEKEWSEAVKAFEDMQKKLEQAQKQYQDTKEHHGKEMEGVKTVEAFVLSKDTELKKERELFLSKMSEQGFENYSSYANAKKNEQQIMMLENEIRSYREEMRSVTDRHAELSTALKEIDPPNLEQLTESFQQVNEQFIKLNEQNTNLMIKKRDNEVIYESIVSINKEMKETEDRYKIVGHLAEMAKGQNTYRITFERFVLAAFLDDILQEANIRLSKMTSGRYQLSRKTDRSKGNVQSGLELLVYDQYTGGERHVKTLSGGESFKAALSLALGLADIVQSYAGGVSLETMFIDEGFGTLDPESLDQAIEALIDIQSSGRLVGIISHVPELKERIDARLEVIATQTGSVTEFQFLN